MPCVYSRYVIMLYDRHHNQGDTWGGKFNIWVGVEILSPPIFQQTGWDPQTGCSSTFWEPQTYTPPNIQHILMPMHMISRN